MDWTKSDELVETIRDLSIPEIERLLRGIVQRVSELSPTRLRLELHEYDQGIKPAVTTIRAALIL